MGGSAGRPGLLTRPLLQVSLMNFLLVLLWAFAMPYCRFRHMASCLSTVWTCIIIVCKMLYQLKIVDPREYSSNCTQVPVPERGCPLLGMLVVAPRGFPGWRWGPAAGARGAEARWCSPLQPQLNGTNLSPEELGNSTLYHGPVDPANWFGIRKGYPNLGYIQVGAGTPRPWGPHLGERLRGRMLSGVPWS